MSLTRDVEALVGRRDWAWRRCPRDREKPRSRSRDRPVLDGKAMAWYSTVPRPESENGVRTQRRVSLYRRRTRPDREWSQGVGRLLNAVGGCVSGRFST